VGIDSLFHIHFLFLSIPNIEMIFVIFNKKFQNVDKKTN
jgi:hypothetical protein